MDRDWLAKEFEAAAPHLTSVAYRMLGSRWRVGRNGLPLRRDHRAPELVIHEIMWSAERPPFNCERSTLKAFR